LPAAIVSSQCINTFKGKLENYLRNMGDSNKLIAHARQQTKNPNK